MNNLTVFANEEFGKVRTVTIDNQPWFVGKDIAAALGYRNASKAVIEHVDTEDRQTDSLKLDSQNGNVGQQARTTTLINESGMYSLVLSSKLPAAKQFKRWITHEVIPQIRKTGSYEIQQEDEKTILSRAVLIAQAQIMQLEEQTSQQAAELAEARPKVELADRLTNCGGYISIGDAAKVIAIRGYGQNNLFRLLKEKGIIMDSYRAYQRYIDNGYFKTEETPYFNIYLQEDRISRKLVVSQKGIAFIIRLIRVDQSEKAA